jgi:capsular polysaccharide biosynthesis protein
VSINFSTPDKKTAEKLSQSIASKISKTTADLNRNQKETTWFQVVAEEPVIVRYQPDFWLILLGSLLAGAFVAFWTVIIKHYLS